MEDESDEVRDWATFGLGSLCVDLKSGQYQDSPEIRDALYARLNDPAARDEAIWGLAQRKDLVGLKILLARLESENCMPGDKQAAEEALHVRGGSVQKLREDLRQLIREES